MVAQVGGNGGVSGLSWSDGGILYTDNSGIVRVSPSGGKPETVVPLAQGETMQGATALPGGAGILFAVAKGREPGIFPSIDLWDGATIVVQPPTGERKTLITNGSDPRYLPTGHLLYARGGTLFVAPFDLKRLTVAGNGMPVLEGVARAILGRSSTGVAQADVSANGSIVYAPGPASPASEPPPLVIVDRAGNVTPLKVPPGVYERPRVSPDGTQLALGSEDSNGATIWIHDLSGDTSMRPLTFQGQGRNRFPVWSADGTYVAFQSDREGAPAIFRQRSDGSSIAERLTTPDKESAHVPESWSSDGKHLLYSVSKAATNTIWAYSLESKKVSRSRMWKHQYAPLLRFRQTGNGSHTRCQPLADRIRSLRSRSRRPAAKYLVGAGIRPLWSRSGKEIFYSGATEERSSKP